MTKSIIGISKLYQIIAVGLNVTYLKNRRDFVYVLELEGVLWKKCKIEGTLEFFLYSSF